jgi:hypothetical protein
MAKGTITRFDAGKGKGKVRLESGEELSFDVSVATSGELRAGQAAEVVTGIGVGAQLRVRLLLVEREEAPPLSFAQGFEALQLLGMLSAWSQEEAQAAAAGADSVSLETSGTLLMAYYGTQGRSLRSQADRVAVLDEHFGDSPRIPVENLVRFAPSSLHQALVAAGASSKPLSLNNMLTAFNAVLQEAQVGQHYFLFDVGADSFAVTALRNDAFARTAHGQVLKIVT